MINKNRARYLIVFISAMIFFSLFSACKKQEIIEIFPPIVFSPRLGGITGGPLNENLVVTAVEKTNGAPVEGATVFVHDSETHELLAEEVTGPDGRASFEGKPIKGPVAITLTCNQTIAYDTISFLGVNSAKVTVPMTRRKTPEKVKTALTFLGLDYDDAKLSINRNEHTFPDIELESGTGKVPEDPWVTSVEDLPLAFSAFSTDLGGNTKKFGFTVEPEGPLSVDTPAMINMVPVSTQNVKTCRGEIENPPANLDTPSTEWDPYKHYIFQVYADGGLAGDVMAGFANIDKGYTYQAFIVETPKLLNGRMEISAFNRRDAWGEMTSRYYPFQFENAPENLDITFLNVPKQLQIEKEKDQVFPDLVWFPSETNLTLVEIHHADFKYRWALYVMGENVGKITLPPIEPGSAGSLVVGEIYGYRVIGWQVPGLDYTNWSFQDIEQKATHRARSSLVQFMVAPTK
ncbi:MAG: hypothetical protein WBM02_06675 [bacterium]